MVRRSLPAAALLSVLALPAQEAPAAPESPWKPCTFHWPVPASVLVQKDGERNGDKAKLRFRIELTAGEGTALRARMVGFEFLEMNGRDATTEAARTALAPTLALTQAVPDVVVDEHGAFLRVDGLDAMFERFAAYLGEQKGVSAAQRDRLLQTLRSPQLQETIQQACGDDWRTWVASWVGFDVAPGAEATTDVRLPFMGAEVEAKATRRNHGPVPEHPGHVRLSVTTTTAAPSTTAAFAAAMERMAAQSGGKPFPKDRLEQVQVEIVSEVVTDPQTLRPLRASRNRTMRIGMKDEPVREQVEKNAFAFDWNAPAPAGR
jgi:hypothetical protein